MIDEWIACQTCGKAIAGIDRVREGDVCHNYLVKIGDECGEPIVRVYAEPDKFIICARLSNG